MIDLHCHLLPGIDDGPATIDDSLVLARAMSALGVTTALATPHVSPRYPNSAATIAGLVGELNARLAAERIALKVLPGAEIALASAVEVPAERLAGLALGGGRWLLIEPPFSRAAIGIDALVLEIVGSGARVVLAHPERCPAFQREPAVLRSLVRAGVLTSITAGSLVGRFGAQVRRFSLELVSEGLVHNVASDAHDTVERPPGIADELTRAGLQPLQRWLTSQLPEAILAGDPLPPAPAVLQQRIGKPRRRLRLPRR